jgi:tryptophan synthase alpha chain
MVKEVIPELSCPVSLFTYYNPILKRGIPNFMTIVKEAGLHGNISCIINHMILVMLFSH